MKIGMMGLGKMGGNMATRLARAGVTVVGYDHSPEVVRSWVASAGIVGAESVEALIAALPAPRVIWLMLPSGAITEEQLVGLSQRLAPGDVVVDGGNSNYHDSERRAALLAEKGIGFMDAGTSGGVWGLENGYCLMVGGTPEVARQVRPFLEILAPHPERGWAHVGPVGAGHYVKMIHNGIEYGMMQSLAEGLALLQGKTTFDLDLAQITDLWGEGSVVRSWLLELTADALRKGVDWNQMAAVVADSGEGRWTAIEAIEQGVPAPVLSLALHLRFQSQDREALTFKLLSVMRHAFGGHAIQASGQ
ncbi:MAG: decarboxylating 6-phosphogluconate dehydrogenase [Ferrovum sp.]|jgi:6-phosphogluconate dehydrogenase|nr:decarboxylating 6-phosphogluconate dehydrogenase [Ferrovum sp.]NDU89425.1 decarboxylating 6-phosphogluconate dehydrogenase [Ferrovum sp.]